jgi:AcrR family transcriptional regulator
MSRTSPVAWLDEGLEALCELGEGALTVDAMCTRMKRTKGSFYHHFLDLRAFQDALLHRWEERQTTNVIREVDPTAPPAERRKHLAAVVRGLDGRLEAAIRAWSTRDGAARSAAAAVDAKRIDYLASIYRDEGVATARARTLARLEYAAFVGALQIFADLDGRDARAAKKMLAKALHWLAINDT